jgi:hypothetical protein
MKKAFVVRLPFGAQQRYIFVMVHDKGPFHLYILLSPKSNWPLKQISSHIEIFSTQ